MAAVMVVCAVHGASPALRNGDRWVCLSCGEDIGLRPVDVALCEKRAAA
jgi:hypothetical protein